jgi:S1-C subfamily serine protease
MARSSPASRRELGALLRSVVKVLCVSDAPDYEQPWQRQGPTSSFGSGAIIATSAGPRILTNAHCVANHVFVQVRRYGNARKYTAEVEALGHVCDLALLRVEDEAFFEGTTPIPIGPLPGLSDRVSVCGFPIGGERLSITEGIVSRIELVHYAQSQRELLAVQIDAAINSGNSGGPVFRDGMLAGVAFQALDDAEQIGYMVAPPIVEHFLRDVESGHYDGFPSLGAQTQPLESRAHRRAIGLPDDWEDGVLVRRVAHGGSACGVLQEGDVLLEVDGVPVAADGTVPLRDGELVHFEYVIASRFVGETINATVWRAAKPLPAGERLSCMIPLRPPSLLVAEDRYDTSPSYYVIGGLVFAPLTRDYLKTWGDSWQQTAKSELLALYEHGLPTRERREPVVLQKVLADRANEGYHDLESLLIETVDDQRIRSLEHLVDLCETTTAPYLRFGGHDGRVLVLDRALAAERHGAILKRFGIGRDRSEDLIRSSSPILSVRPTTLSEPPHTKRAG